MMQWFRLIVLVAVVIAMAAFPAVSSAKNDKHEQGHEQGHEKHSEKHSGKGEDGEGQKHQEESQQSDGVIIIYPGHRTIIQEYYTKRYVSKGKCPPGLAKKNNGCLPPGQAQKVWQLQQPLPTYVVLRPLPKNLVMKLGPPPVGYDYGYVDGDVLLYSTVGKVVVDAISSLF